MGWWPAVGVLPPKDRPYRRHGPTDVTTRRTPLTQYVEEFREWMVFLASRDHIVRVGGELYNCLADELCRPEGTSGEPLGYPRLCRLALVHGGVPRPPSVPMQKQDQFWRTQYGTQWREAADLAKAPDKQAWGDRFVTALVLSRGFVVRIARQRPAAGAEDEREMVIASASDRLFDRMWQRRKAQVAAAGFRTAFCAAKAHSHDPDKRAKRHLMLNIRSWLTEGGTQTEVAPERGDGTAPIVPMISGNRVKLVVRFLRLSSQLILQCKIERALGIEAADAEQLAALVKAVRRQPGDSEALGALRTTLMDRLGGHAAAKRSNDDPASPAGKEAIEAVIESLAGRSGTPPRLQENRRSFEHALALLDLCQRQTDPELPNTIEKVQDWLARYGGAASILVSLETPASSSADAASIGDAIEDEQAGRAPRTPLDEVLIGIYDDPQLVLSVKLLLDRLLPNDGCRKLGALLLGLPSLLPDNALPSLRLQAEAGPPRNEAAWDRLARQFGQDKKILKKKAQELRQALRNAVRPSPQFN